jgi:hypothetical protein
MASSRQEQERQRQREEARRRAALERRQDEERQRAREEARRAEARTERLAFEAELESARIRREALISRIREERGRERVAAERLTERQSETLGRAREEQQDRRRGAEAAAERRERIRQANAEARRLEDRTESTRQARATLERDAARRSERRAAMEAARVEDRSARSGPRADARAPKAAADRARADRRDRARRDAEAAERAASARAARVADARSARLDEARALRQARVREASSKEQAVAGAAADRRAAESRDRRRADLGERALPGTAADRRNERRRTDRLAPTSAAPATERRERERAARLSAERTVAERTRSRRDRMASRPAEPTLPAREPLDDPIPSGILSGSLPWLRVDGTRLVTPRDHPVTLRGANVSGFGPPGHGHDLAAAGLDEAGIDALLGLGVGALRVPIDADRVLAGSDPQGAGDAPTDLDRIVEQAAAKGAYTILSLRTVEDAPGYDSIGLWRIVGERYADEPAVLFDLFDPPDAPPDDPTGVDTDWERWSLWVRLTVAELRRAHPRAVCVVAGPDRGTDLAGFPIVGTAGEPIPNIVYATTLSPDRPELPLHALARRLPILVTELDVPASGVAARTATLAALGVGWMAAARSDRPLIAPSRGGRLEPTVLGTSIQRVLSAVPGRPLIEPPSRPPSTYALTV